MRHVNKLRDLEEFGIVCLTGEADRLGMRILCDVTERGRKLVCEALGLPPSMSFAENWNSGGAGEKHVGSILLDPWQFRMLAVIALLDAGCPQVLVFSDGRVWGTDSGERIADEGEYDSASDSWKANRVYHRDGICNPWPSCYGWPDRIVENPNGVYRNRHEMSGRID